MQQLFGELRSLPPCDPDRSSPPRSGQAAQSRDLAFLVGASHATRISLLYTMQSASRRGLYIDMTNNLDCRVWQCKTHVFEGFTDDYHDARLVYWQSFDDVCKASNREKQLKNWRRAKTLRLIATMNPRWQDLAADWYETAAIVPKPALPKVPGLWRPFTW